VLDVLLDAIWDRCVELWVTDRGYYVVSAPTGHLETLPELADLRPDQPVETLWEEIRRQSSLLIPTDVPVETAVWIDARGRMWRATYFRSIHPIVVLRRVGFPFTTADYPEPFQRFVPTLIGEGRGLILMGGPIGGGKSALLSVFLRELTRQPIGIGIYEESLELDLPPDRAVVFHRLRGVHYQDLASALESDRRVMLRAVAVQEVTEREVPALLHPIRMGRLVLTTMHAVSLRELLYRLSQAVGGSAVLADMLTALIMVHLRSGVQGRIIPVPSVFRPTGSVRISLERGDLDGALQAHEHDREGLDNLPESVVLSWLEAQGWIEPASAFHIGRTYIQEVQGGSPLRRTISGGLGLRFSAKVQVQDGTVNVLQIRPFRDEEACARIQEAARSWPDGFYQVELTE
jgi:Tfp pilus assembly pilus retraction ATPase PilT